MITRLTIINENIEIVGPSLGPALRTGGHDAVRVPNNCHENRKTLSTM